MNSFVGFNTSIVENTLIVTPASIPSTKDEALAAISALTEYMKNNAVKLNVSDDYLDVLVKLIK